MTTPVETALYALKAVVELLDPAPQRPLEAVWVYPYEYSHIRLERLPLAIVSKVKGVINPIGRKAVGRSLKLWRAEVLIPLGKGELNFPNEASAAVEATEEEYIEAMEAILFANENLSGTVNSIGEGEGSNFRIAEYMTAHWWWNREAYWCHRFVIPVRQSRLY